MIYTWFLTNGLKLGGILALFGAIWLHGCHYGETEQEKVTDKLRIEFNTFVNKTEEAGKAADAKARAIEAAHKLSKEKADAAHKSTLSEYRDYVGRVRLSRSRSSFLPSAPADAGSPESIAFDRAELDGAIRKFDTGVQSLIEQGDEKRIALDAAIKWAAENFQAK